MLAPDEKKKVVPPFPYYLLGSVVVWMVVWPLADLVIGDWRGLGSSLANGLFMGLFVGLAMYPFERWLRRREERKKAREQSPPATPGRSAGR